MMEVLARNWALVVLRGAAAVLFGLVTLLAPAISLAVLVFFFGAYALADGIFTAIAAVANRRNLARVLGVFIEDLQEFQHALETEDRAAIEAFFHEAKQRRDGWSAQSASPSPE